jgi:hypothetical protein
MTTVEENRDDIRAIYDLIRRHRPDARLICALSPLPMIATARQTSFIAANSVSKSVVRVAIDEVHRDLAEEGHFFYWPLYDVLMEGFGASPYGGHFNGDRRHVNDAALDYMLRQFETQYCRIRKPSRSVFQAYVEAKVDALELPAEILQAVDRADRRAIQHLINHYERIDDQPTAELIERYAAERLNLDSAARTEEWTIADLAWQGLPSLERVGPAPQTLTTPSTAWGYGASSSAVQATGGEDLVVRVRLQVQSGVVGVMLMRPDGSAISDRDRRVDCEDGQVLVDLRVYPEDGVAHVLLRNYDSEGVAGVVEVQAVATRSVAPESPRIGAWGAEDGSGTRVRGASDAPAPITEEPLPVRVRQPQP